MKTLLFIVNLAMALPFLEAHGDAARGKEIYERACTGCHSVKFDRVGPRHQGVFGRQAGSLEGYDFSPALKKSKIVWREEELKAWLKGPSEFVPGSKMGFKLSSEEEIQHLIDYLKSI